MPWCSVAMQPMCGDIRLCLRLQSSHRRLARHLLQWQPPEQDLFLPGLRPAEDRGQGHRDSLQGEPQPSGLSLQTLQQEVGIYTYM